MTNSTKHSDTYFALLDSAACMPSTCWGSYRRLAILEIVDGCSPPAIITDRAKQVVGVVARWEDLNVGKTSRCAYERALAEARVVCEDLNARRPA